ncbi:MAG: glycerol-3-phosphate dehydrogenase/oxidase [Deltaproteobacteria bacterium]|nr:glycerol-3-phosphate dehydrogenase/oxidase [Deltaproteobacteria bacterium]
MTALEGREFDLLVVGGGIYGAWTALDAALRGLRVAMVEQNDWGSGTSQASSKLMHGGLRYLEQYRFGLVRHSLQERQRLMTLAPHAVRPLRFVVPLYPEGPAHPLVLKAGLTLYDGLAGKLPASQRHQWIPRGVMEQSWPYLRRQDLRGGFSYPDGQTDDARLTLEVVWGAARAGAVVVNHARAVELLWGHSSGAGSSLAGNRVAGAAVVCQLTGKSVEVKARMTVAAAGPWIGGLAKAGRAGKVLAQRGNPPAFRLTKGVHLILPPLPGNEAHLLRHVRDSRVFFVIPWYGHTLVGTTDTAYHGPPEDCRVQPEDTAYLLEGLAGAGIQRSEGDVLGRFAGLRTLRSMEGDPSAVSREWEMEMPLPGLWVPIGGKLTSARADAALLTNKCMTLLGRDPGGESPTSRQPTPWSPRPDTQTRKPAWNAEVWLTQARAQCQAAGFTDAQAHWAPLRYGNRLPGLLSRIAAQPALGKPLHPDLPFLWDEVNMALEEEMALTLEDVLRRRLPLVLLRPAAREVLTAVARRMAEKLGWSPEREAQEVAHGMSLGKE